MSHNFIKLPFSSNIKLKQGRLTFDIKFIRNYFLTLKYFDKYMQQKLKIYGRIFIPLKLNL